MNNPNRLPRLGYDASALPPRLTGAGNYIVELLRALHRLDLPLDFRVFCTPSGRQQIGLPEKTGFRYITVPALHPTLRLLWEQTRLPRLAKQHRLDLLHSPHYTRPLRLPCRSVVTLHDMTFFLFPELHTLPKRFFFPWMIRRSASSADALLAISESTRQDAIRLLGIDPGRIHTTLLAALPEHQPVSDPERRRAVRQRYNLPEQFILNVGVLEPRKNLPVLFQAFARLRSRFPEYRLVIAGKPGWMVEQIKSQLAALQLGDSVHFTGYVQAQDLPVVYNLAALSVYPSLYEGFGLPVLESLACGTPVITTNVSSMPEIAGEAGMLVPPGDIAALENALEKLLNNPDERERRSRLGLEQARQFTWERTAQATYQVYRQVLGV